MVGVLGYMFLKNEKYWPFNSYYLLKIGFDGHHQTEKKTSVYVYNDWKHFFNK